MARKTLFRRREASSSHDSVARNREGGRGPLRVEGGQQVLRIFPRWEIVKHLGWLVHFTAVSFHRVMDADTSLLNFLQEQIGGNVALLQDAAALADRS